MPVKYLKGNHRFHRVVLDESHLANFGSKNLTACARYRWAVSGTPFGSSISGLWQRVFVSVSVSVCVHTSKYVQRTEHG